MVDAGGISWGQDGIYFDGRLAGDGIAVVHGPGETPTVVTTPDTATGELWHFQPEALPNGKGLLFVAAFGGAVERMQIGVFDFKTRRHRLLGAGLSPRWVSTGHVLFVTSSGVLMAVPFDADRLEPTGEPRPVASGMALRGLGHVDLAVASQGTLLYAAGSASGTREELVWVTRDGNAKSVDTTWQANFSRLELSPDGSYLATSLYDAAGRQVWVKELDRGPLVRLSFEGNQNDNPSWSPDGKRVVFSHTDQNGRVAIYAGPSDGRIAPQNLMEGSARLRSARYSPDGKWLLLLVGTDLFVRTADGDTALTPLIASNAQERQGVISPDGRWLAYESDESGRSEIYVRPFPDASTFKRQVSVGGGLTARWSADGREIFFENPARELVSVPIHPGPTFSVGEPRVLYSTSPFIRTPWLVFDVHPDGQRFIMARRLQAPTSGDELVVVLNFFEELKRK
jgi:serine/threonine-protein kinase